MLTLVCIISVLFCQAFTFQFNVHQSAGSNYTLKYEGSSKLHPRPGHPNGDCYYPDSELTFSYSVPTGTHPHGPKLDWIGVYEVGQCDDGVCPDDDYVPAWEYIVDTQHPSGKIVIQAPIRHDGLITYNAYYLVDNGNRYVAMSASFTIDSCPGEWKLDFEPDTLKKGTLAMNSKATFKYSMVRPHYGGAFDWIGFYALDRCDPGNQTCPTDDRSDEPWGYLNGLHDPPENWSNATEGKMVLNTPNKKGLYIAYYFSSPFFHLDRYRYVAETAPFCVGCSTNAVYNLNFVSASKFGEKNSHLNVTSDSRNCIKNPNHHVELTFKWNVTGEQGTAIDWIGIYEFVPCHLDEPHCNIGQEAGSGTSWKYISNSQGYEKTFKATNNGEVKIIAPLDAQSHTLNGRYIAYYFVNDGDEPVVQSEPFEIRIACEKQLMNGFAFLVLMGCVAGVALIALIGVVIVKKFGGCGGFTIGGSSSNDVKYSELNKDEDSSHEEYDNQLSITSSDEDRQ